MKLPGPLSDVSDLAQVQGLADRAFATFGTVHVLCNNAGVGGAGGGSGAAAADQPAEVVVNGANVTNVRVVARRPTPQ